MTRHIASERTGVYQIVSPPNAAASVSSTALCSTRPRPTEMLMAGRGAQAPSKSPDDDVEAKEQIRNAVMPERAHRVRDQLLPRVREVEAHELRRKDVKSEEERRREDADGRERVAQKFLTARVILFAVVIAHKRLRALRDRRP